MAWPSGTALEEQITNAIVSKVGAIATPTYKTDIAKSQLIRSDGFELNEYPAFLIGTPRATYNDQRMGMVETSLDYDALVAVSSMDDAHGAIVDAVQDIRVALLSDPTLGGLALDTHITDATAEAHDGLTSIVTAALSINVEFRHERGISTADPATAV